MAEAVSDDGVPAVLINNLLDDAERLLRNQRFDLPAAQDLLTSLWTSHLRDANGGASEAELLLVTVSTAQRIVRHYYAELEQNKREVYDRNQTWLLLLCALAAFPSALTLTDNGAEGLQFTFKCARSLPGDQQQQPELFLQEVRGMFDRCNCLNALDPHRDMKIETLLEFTSWIKRKRPAVAFFIANMIHSLYQGVKSLTYMFYGRCPLGVDMNHLIHFAGIEGVFCLIRLGFMEKASEVLESLPRGTS